MASVKFTASKHERHILKLNFFAIDNQNIFMAEAIDAFIKCNSPQFVLSFHQ